MRFHSKWHIRDYYYETHGEDGIIDVDDSFDKPVLPELPKKVKVEFQEFQKGFIQELLFK